MVHMPPYFRNPPRYIRSSHTDIININVGSGCGGHVHHCSGGWGMSKGMSTMFGIGLLTSFLGNLFNRGNSQATMIQQPMFMMPQQPMLYGYNNYNMGYNAGLYTPGSANGMQNSGYNAGFNQGLYGSTNPYGQYSNMQGQYGQQQQTLATKANELVSMVKDLGNDYGFTFGENEEIPKMSADGQQYTYKGKTFDTVTDLRNFIEKQEGLGCTPNSPLAQDDTEIVSETPIVINGNEDTESEETTSTNPTTANRPNVTDEEPAEDVSSQSNQSTQNVKPETTPVSTRPTLSGKVMTKEQSEIMFAELNEVFGEIPAGVELNSDGTYNYGKYQNIGINALKYAVSAKKNYESTPETKVDYNNFVNNYNGRIYSDGQLSITKQQISNTETLGAFLVRNNPETSIELGKISAEDFEKTFKNMLEDNVKNAKNSITLEKFIKYHQAYEANAKNGILRRDNERQKYETVDITSADSANLRNMFSAMSNGKNTLSKEQYVKFMTELFSHHNGKLTRAQFDDFCVNWINKNN